MVKAAYRADSPRVPKTELAEAARKFLLNERLDRHSYCVLDNIDSPRFGSSDLVFIDRERTKLSVVRINIGEDCEKFAVSSISYYYWLKDFIALGENLYGRKCELEIYLFAPDFSGVRFLLQRLPGDFRLDLIEYVFLRVEGLEEPVVYFQTDGSPEQAPTGGKRQEKIKIPDEEETVGSADLSKEELDEFNRLRALYLPGLKE